MQPRVGIAEVLDVPGAREAGISAAHAPLRLLERRASILRMMAAYLAGMHLLAFQMRTTTWGTTTPRNLATGRAQRARKQPSWLTRSETIRELAIHSLCAPLPP